MATLVVGTRGTRSSDSTVVTLSASRGSLESNRLVVTQGGAVVKLRSAGLGPAVISARAPGWSPAQVTIAYRWPITFLIAALLGGLLGGLVAHARTKRRRTASVGQFLLKGTGVGLLVCVAYFGVGINLLQLDIKVQFVNELVVFALVALAAAFGIPALSPARD
jgi:peptidoglycan/LPS O-acetylase OafA/YrhL